jgi:hypothetical protein
MLTAISVTLVRSITIVNYSLIANAPMVEHGSILTPNLKAMSLLACNFHLQEIKKYKVGMLQWQMLNSKVIKIVKVLTLQITQMARLACHRFLSTN